MADGIGDILSEVGNAIASGFGFGSQDGSEWNEAFRSVTNNPTYDDGAWRKSLGYGFRVVRVQNNTIDADPAAGWQRFKLQIPPQELNQSEIFAINVTPTFRGVIVEHQGSVLKDITISGTTGISPNRKEGGAISNSGKPVLSSGRSGYEEFHNLRSYFRAYVEEKRLDSGDLGELRLIFDNFKDHEHIYVEPQKFDLKRSSTRPMMYNYNIVMKGIGNADAVDPDTNILDSALDNLDTALGYLNDGLGFINGAIGVVQRIEGAIESAIIGPLNTLATAAAALRNGEESLFGAFGTFSLAESSLQATLDRLRNESPTTTLPPQRDKITLEIVEKPPIPQSPRPVTTEIGGQVRTNPTFPDLGITTQSIDELAVEIQRVSDNLAESLGINLSVYNSAIGRITTLASTQTTRTTLEEEALHGLTLANRGLTLIVAQKELFEGDADESNNRVSSIYGNEITFPALGSTRSTNVSGSDTIHTIALRELGNADRYRELVTLNNLVPPYISTTASKGVLVSGDQILIPMRQVADDLGAKKTKEFNVTAGLSTAEKALGVDLRLDKNNDIAFNNIGDFDAQAGVLNYAQAILMRVLTEKKSLKRHPSYGAGIRIGEKMTSQNIGDIRGRIQSGISSDPRTEKVPFLRTEIDGGSLKMLIVAKPKNIKQTIPIPINLNV